MPTGPFEGPARLARISTLQLSQPTGNNTIETGGGYGGCTQNSPNLRSRGANLVCRGLRCFTSTPFHCGSGFNFSQPAPSLICQ